EDRAGVLWILNQFGLMSYRNGAFQSYGIADGLPEGIFQFFEDDRDGLILISNRGVFLWRDGRSSRLDAEVSPPIGRFGYKDKSGGIWCNIGAALVHFTSDGKNARYPNPPQRQDAPQQPISWANCMYEDRRGNVWLGTHTGLHRVIGDRIVREEL